jgi:hypothetical protein
MIVDAFANSAPVVDDERDPLTKSFRRSRPSSVARPISLSPKGTGASKRTVTVPRKATVPNRTGKIPHISLRMAAVHVPCARFGPSR